MAASVWHPLGNGKMREARAPMSSPRTLLSQRELVITRQPACACDTVAAWSGVAVLNHPQMT